MTSWAQSRGSGSALSMNWRRSRLESKRAKPAKRECKERMHENADRIKEVSVPLFSHRNATPLPAVYGQDSALVLGNAILQLSKLSKLKLVETMWNSVSLVARLLTQGEAAAAGAEHVRTGFARTSASKRGEGHQLFDVCQRMQARSSLHLLTCVFLLLGLVYKGLFGPGETDSSRRRPHLPQNPGSFEQNTRHLYCL